MTQLDDVAGIGHFHYDYNYHNPFFLGGGGGRILVVIRAIVLQLLSTGKTNFEYEMETEMNSGSSSQVTPS